MVFHISKRQLLNSLPSTYLKWIGRPDLDVGLAFYIRIFGLRTLETIKNHDFTEKAVLTPDLFGALDNGGKSPEWNVFKSLYSDFFEFVEQPDFEPCPGQQTLESVMAYKAPEKEPEKVENNEPGSVYGDTPNNIKQQPISFADMFNKSAQPLEIDGKRYLPHLELLDVDRD